jgi:hypothetical protein
MDLISQDSKSQSLIPDGFLGMYKKFGIFPVWGMLLFSDVTVSLRDNTVSQKASTVLYSYSMIF